MAHDFVPELRFGQWPSAICSATCGAGNQADAMQIVAVAHGQ